MRPKNRLLFSIAIAATLAGCFGCAAHKAPTSALPPSVHRGYVDLEPGWRIRVVTPILKSGKFIVHAEAVQSSGNEIVVKASDDFIGYEIAYYSVKAQAGGGIFIRFSSAETVKDGKAAKQPRPLVPLFDLPANMRFVRLVFLLRVSEADHDQGILAAASLAELDALTQRVQAEPEKNCTTAPEAFCSWIPRGIAAQPEKRNPARRNEWVAVW